MKKLGFMLLLLMAIVTNVNADAQYYLNQTYAKFPVYRNEPVSMTWNNGDSFKGNKFTVDGVVNNITGIYTWRDGSYFNGNFNAHFQMNGRGTLYVASEKNGITPSTATASS